MYISFWGPTCAEGITGDIFVHWLSCDHAVVAAIALYLCQAHKPVLLLSKEADVIARKNQPNQRDDKMLTFGMERKGQEIHKSSHK